MIWKTDEWDGFSLLLEKWWKGEFSDADQTAWKYALDDVDPKLAVATLKLMLRRGETWRPSVAEFVAAMEGQLAPALSFDEAWPGIYAAMSRYNPLDPMAVTHTLERVAMTAGGECAAGWLSAFGVGRLALEPVDDPAFGGAVLKRLRDSWVEMTGRPEQRDRLVRGLGEARRGELGRVDAVGLLAVESSVAIGVGEDGN